MGSQRSFIFVYYVSSLLLWRKMKKFWRDNCIGLAWATFSTSASGESVLSLEGLAPNCIAARRLWKCLLQDEFYWRVGVYSYGLCRNRSTPITYACTKFEANANYLPETCVRWNDGCNSCFRNLVTDSRACTKMYCQEPTSASCTEYAKWPFAIINEES